MVTIDSNPNHGASLFSKARSEILSLLYADPEKELYLREIVRITGLGVGPVQRELSNLVGLGLVGRRKSGHQVYFKACQNPIFDELRSILLKTAWGARTVKSALSPLRKKIHKAFIYGSYARGEMSGLSDIDVMVIGNVSLEEVVEVLLPSMEKLHRKISPTVITEKEFYEKLEKDHYFIASVYHGKKISLIEDGNVT